MYSNNLGDLNSSRNPPVLNEYNTDPEKIVYVQNVIKQIQKKGFTIRN